MFLKKIFFNWNRIVSPSSSCFPFRPARNPLSNPLLSLCSSQFDNYFLWLLLSHTYICVGGYINTNYPVHFACVNMLLRIFDILKIMFFSNNCEPQKVRQKQCELYYYIYFCITLCLLLKLFWGFIYTLIVFKLCFKTV